MSNLTEAAVARRIPSLTEERLRVLSRRQPVTVLPGTSLAELDLDQTIRDAIVLMPTGRYRNVPVVDATGHLVGVVRQSDIIRDLAESFPEALLNLPPRPHQRMKVPEGA